MAKTDVSLLYYDCLCLIRHAGVNADTIEFILDLLVPKNQDGDSMVNISIKDTSLKNAASFIPQTKVIHVSMDKVDNWLKDNAQEMAYEFEYNNVNNFKNYLLLFMITHEIEHSKQYFIGLGDIEHESINVKNGYKLLFEMITRNIKPGVVNPKYIKRVRRMVSLMIYDKYHDSFILERNANIEACDKMLSIALLEEDVKMYNAFVKMRELFMKQGYINSCKGSLHETFKCIKMFDKYNELYMEEKFDEIDNIRYGLPIKDETRRLLLKRDI